MSNIRKIGVYDDAVLGKDSHSGIDGGPVRSYLNRGACCHHGPAFQRCSTSLSVNSTGRLSFLSPNFDSIALLYRPIMTDVDKTAAKLAYLRSDKGQAVLSDSIEESLLKVDVFSHLSLYENVSVTGLAVASGGTNRMIARHCR